MRNQIRVLERPRGERRGGAGVGRGSVLAVTAAAQFMVILDVSVVNVALPVIKDDLHFSQEGLQWVITAYAILFGGTLCWAAVSPTCSVAGACSWPGWGCSRSPRCCPGWPVGRRADPHAGTPGARRRTARTGGALDRRHDLP